MITTCGVNMSNIRKKYDDRFTFSINVDRDYKRNQEQFYINKKIDYFTRDFIEILCPYDEDETLFKVIGISKKIENFKG